MIFNPWWSSWFVITNTVEYMICNQGWEFAHLISEQIASFLVKNERMSDLLKKWEIRSKNERFTHLLIFGEWLEIFAHDRSFPLSESLMVAHFGERP